jgi:hypothetical protein
MGHVFVIRNMQGPAISAGPFALLEVHMNPIAAAIGLLVSAFLDWLMDKK